MCETLYANEENKGRSRSEIWLEALESHMRKYRDGHARNSMLGAYRWDYRGREVASILGDGKGRPVAAVVRRKLDENGSFLEGRMELQALTEDGAPCGDPVDVPCDSHVAGYFAQRLRMQMRDPVA